MKENFKTFFNNNLHGKFAYISCGGLNVEGVIEQKCKLVFFEHTGLECFIKIKPNHTDLTEIIRVKLLEIKDKINFDFHVFGEIYKELSTVVDDTYLRVANIRLVNIKSILCDYLDDNLHTCTITFNDNSIVKIKCITDN